jgi:PAS domain S-box-containing protein
MPAGVSRPVIEVLLDRVSQGVATLAPDATLTYLNQRIASMVGQARPRLLGKPLSGLVAPADREALAETLQTARETAAQRRVSVLHADGAERKALLQFAPLGHGQVSCLITQLHDSGDATLTHELRFLVSTLHLTTEALKRSLLDLDGQRALGSLERQSARLLQLLNPPE